MSGAPFASRVRSRRDLYGVPFSPSCFRVTQFVDPVLEIFALDLASMGGVYVAYARSRRPCFSALPDFEVQALFASDYYQASARALATLILC